jgi:hypothetical protein
MTHLELAKACLHSYKTTENTHSVHEVDADILEYDNCYVIAFRGTEKTSASEVTNVVDTIRNFTFWRHKTRIGAIAHKGFAVGSDKWLYKFYLKLVGAKKPFVITGHSQGAAIAVQLVPLMVSKGFDVRGCVVFGEPASWRSGDERLYKSCNVPSTSYLNENDWIRFAPPWGSTGVPRTYLNRKKGISKKAHSMDSYIKAIEECSPEAYLRLEEPLP